MQFFLCPLKDTFFIESVKSELAVTTTVKDHGNFVLAEPDIELNSLEIMIDCALKSLHRVFGAKKTATVAEYQGVFARLLLKAVYKMFLRFCRCLHSTIG